MGLSSEARSVTKPFSLSTKTELSFTFVTLSPPAEMAAMVMINRKPATAERMMMPHMVASTYLKNDFMFFRLN